MTLEMYLEKLRNEKTPVNLQMPLTQYNVQRFWEWFKCQRCGYCCTGLSDIYVSDKDIERISIFTCLSRKKIKKKTYLEGNKRRLKKPCPFYDNGCTIYDARPDICRQYPIIPFNGELHISSQCKGTESLCKKVISKRLEYLKML